MKARPRATVTRLTQWVGRRGGSWYNMGAVAPALSQNHRTNCVDNRIGFRTVLTHRATRATP